MNSIQRIFLLIVISAGFSVLSIAQETGWSLDECISYAMENNISLKRQELASDLNKKDLTQSKLNVLPNLNGQVQHNMGSGRLLDEGTYEWVNTDLRQGTLGLATNVTLFGGLTAYNTIKMMEANYLASRESLELFENNGSRCSCCPEWTFRPEFSSSLVLLSFTCGYSLGYASGLCLVIQEDLF